MRHNQLAVSDKFPKTMHTLLKYFYVFMLMAFMPIYSTAQDSIFLTALDLEGRPLAGIRFSFQGYESRPTTDVGATEIALPDDITSGMQIKINVLPSADDWFLVGSLVNVGREVELRLMRRSEFRLLTKNVRDVIEQSPQDTEINAEERRRLATEIAEDNWALPEEQLFSAAINFGATAQHPIDQGIQAYLEGDLSRAELSFLRAIDLAKQRWSKSEEMIEESEEVIEKAKTEFIESTLYLGQLLRQEGRYTDSIHAYLRAVKVEPENVNILAGLGVTYIKNGEYDKAKRVLSKATTFAQTSLGLEHATTLFSKNSLAESLRYKGDLLAARKLHEEVLRVRRRVLGLSHPSTMNTATVLAQTVSAQGDWSAAQALYEEILVVARNMFGSTHYKTLTYTENLADILQVQGKAGAASQLRARLSELRRAESKERLKAMSLDIKSDLLANAAVEPQGDLPAAARSFYNEGNFFDSEAVAEEGFDVAFDVRAIRESDLSSSTAMMNRANAFIEKGDLRNAHYLYEKVIKIIDGCVCPERLPVGMNNLAEVKKMMGDLTGSEALHRQVLQIRVGELGPKHPDTLNSKHNLADVVRLQGKLHEAKRLLSEVLDDRREVLGADHPDTLVSMNNLAETMRMQGDLSEARRLHEETLASRRRTLGYRHRDTLESMNNLAEVVRAQGDLAGAKELHLKTLKIRREVLGHEHPDTLTTKNNLAEVERGLNNLNIARQMHESVLAVRRRVLGPSDESKVAFELLERNIPRFEESWPNDNWQYGSASSEDLEVDLVEMKDGLHHPDILISTNNLAETIRMQGDLRRARELHDINLSNRLGTLGDMHPETMVSAWNLMVVLEGLGEKARASQILAKHLCWLKRRREDSLASVSDRKIRRAIGNRCSSLESI